MITFNELSSRVANILNKVNDHALRERTKAAFKDTFATRIRQSIEKNGIDASMLFTITIPLEPNEAKSNRHFIVYNTSVPVPIPSRIKNDAPFTYVGVNKPTDDLVPFSIRNETEIRLSLKKKLQGLFRYYTHEHSIVTLYFKCQSKPHAADLSEVTSVNLTSIFEDPEQIADLYTNESGDYPIPYPRDMIESILQEILKTEFGYITPETEIKS